MISWYHEYHYNQILYSDIWKIGIKILYVGIPLLRLHMSIMSPVPPVFVPHGSRWS